MLLWIMIVNAAFWGALFFVMLWWMLGASMKSEETLARLEKKQTGSQNK